MLLNQQKTTTKLDPRVKRTRKVLKQAFTELLVEKTFADITVQDITERAEVNRATFYAHFDDKYALMDYAVRESLQEALENCLPDANALTLANLRMLSVTVNDFVGQFVGHCHPGTHSEEQLRMAAQAQQYVYEVILSWLKTAKSIPEESATNIAAALSWVIFGVGFQSAIMRGKQSPEQLADQVIAFLTPSLKDYLPNG